MYPRSGATAARIKSGPPEGRDGQAILVFAPLRSADALVALERPSARVRHRDPRVLGRIPQAEDHIAQAEPALIAGREIVESARSRVAFQRLDILVDLRALRVRPELA